ncbi:MAG: bifunctional precorrin-2 dehydrogenase/sirohydrochlorin ferrochelatase [Lentisphaerae bacterium]|nr:bifunctional precorrin-2 dehydrogenase/sirohydrochlorin ferrochelatase [Lentisphaerota bacterium]
MRTFPINITLTGLKVLVVGGGAVAAEKLEKLIPHRPRLTLVSPQLAPVTERLVREHALTWLPEPYATAHIGDHRLVFAATDDNAVNRRIYEDTRGLPVLVNAADLPACCDFIMPAVVSGEHFTLAISTGGLAAGYARQWREQLEAAVAQEDTILDLLDRIRTQLKRKVETFPARRARLWEILKELEQLERRD